MNPDIDKIIGYSVQKLAAEIAPSLSDSFQQSQIGLMSIVLGFAAREYERGAELRVGENAEMRRLFDSCAPKIEDGSLREELQEAAATKDESLRITALNQTNWALRRLLITLQAHLEDRSDDAARVMRRQVWDVLRKMAESRMISLPGR